MSDTQDSSFILHPSSFRERREQRIAAAQQEDDPTTERVPIVRPARNWMVSLLDSVEQTAQRLIEPSPARSQRPLTQKQLAQAIEDELEETLHYLMEETLAHNVFTVWLDSADFAHYAPFKRRGEQELAAYVQKLTDARDYVLLGSVTVTVEAQRSADQPRIVVTSTIEEMEPQIAPILELRSTQQQFPLIEAVTTLGRSGSNHICLDKLDTRRVVSRQHARIERRDSGYLLFDCGSKWGTTVNGMTVNASGHPLRDGDEIVFGTAGWHVPAAETLAFRFQLPTTEA